MNKMSIINTPHLPKGKVGCILIGERYRERLEAPLKLINIDVIWIPDNRRVDPRLRGHVDLSLIHMHGNKLVGYQGEYVKTLTNRGLDVVSAASSQRADYPYDAGLNGCIIGSFFIHNTALTDKAVLQNLGCLKIINVNQGYAKCSVCVVNEHAIITSDYGIANTIKNTGIDVLLIEPGYIKLSGFDYGFIGGSTFKLSEFELAFTGKLENHPDKDRILNYLISKGVSPVFLTNDPIFDIGSAIPLLNG